MSKIHRLSAYLKYLVRARGRHGVHSPFVYQLTENLLQKKLPELKSGLAIAQHSQLVNVLISYFQCKHILWICNGEGESETLISMSRTPAGDVSIRTERFEYHQFGDFPLPDACLMNLDDPAKWLLAWQKYREHIGTGSMVIISSIHFSEAHTAAWNSIRADETVRLSIDLYRVGLLFFREEFKERQHFVLKAKI